MSLSARSRKAHTRGVNILPSLLCISGANFRLFLRFKDPVSKWTGISPRGRLQPPPCPKTRSDALRHTLPCSNTPYPAATCHTQRQHALAARHRAPPGVARPPNSLHPTPFTPRLSTHQPLRPFPHHPTPPVSPTHPWPRKTAPTVSMLSVTGRPPESEASV